MSQIEPDPATVPLPDPSPPTNPAPLQDPNSEPIAEYYGQKDVDLLDRIKGMYRLLYVYKEAATSGLVDKIIIDQESLGKLMNTIIPRSYSSLSKINFGALDETSIQPVGIYGSKSQIVRLLQHLNCVDQETADHLLQDRNEHVIHQPWLQSGIYYLNPNIGSTETAGLVSYIIYWPDDTTWDDGAEDAVRRTRTTFMRYLSRLVGQTFALISPEHASKLVSMGDHKSLEGTKSQEDKVIEQRNDEDNNSDDSDNDNDKDFGRIINFKVLKTQHEEEGLTVSQGFSITHQAIKSQDPHSSSVPLEGESQQAPRIPTSPRIITGECCFGFLSIEYRPPGQESRPPPDSEKSRMMLDHESSHHKNIFLAPDLSLSGIEALIGLNSVKKRAGKIIQDYQNELQRIDDRKTASVASSLASIEAGLQKEVNTLRAGCRSIVVSKLVEIYPTLDVSKCSAADIDMDDTHKAYLQSLQDANVGLSDIQSLVLSRANLSQVPSHKFKAAKSKYPRLIQHLKLVADPAPLIREFIENKDTGNQASTAWSKLSSGLRFLSFMNKRPGLSPGESASSGGKVPETTDSDFIASIVAIPDDDVTSPVKEHILNLFYEGIDKHIENVTEELVSEYQKSIKEEQVGLVQAQAENQGQMDISKAHELFLNKLRVALAPTSATRAGITFESIEPIDHRPNYYRVTSRETNDISGALRVNVHTLSLTEDDHRKLDQDPSHPVVPLVASWGSFEIPDDYSVRCCQFLERGAKCLVVIEEPGEVAIFVVNMATIAQLPSSAPLRRLKKSGNRHFIIAVDERRHLLAVTTTTESGVFLQMYAFDKAFSNLHARGSPLDITGYYNDGLPSFHSTHFTGEAEELCLVEESGRIRVFSFISQTFRPAIVNIDSFVSVFPSTEGAALLVLKRSEGGYGLRSFHWESFGHNPEGILADLGDDADLASCSSWGVASFRNHSFPLLLALDGDRHVIKSFRLQISRKDTVFSLRSKNRSSKDIGKSATSNNSLIDCHATVWSKYPIVPAIKTEAFAPKVQCPTSLSFVTDASEFFSFPSYFKSLVKDFEYKTRKPTDGRLEAIEIRALSFNDVDWRKHSQANVYTTGEWMAGLLCLIPIQIAVARENRFIPLKDGVLDTATEQSLLGAEIGDIIDAISIGWYESIFNSYMAEKPVKVISSLGEQSVGKSYALNHMVDSSFAGSAYRTTEGVWLSVCPTKDMLIVAVDFEGVHSIERSPQEDMLLVLFNTALSNMVLFRNNFAFSRDIANMFTSFQSSTSLLDPAANPKLFKSVLAVIIKDVVEADQKEIVAEFQSKLSKIVSEEQAMNFISVLHASRLSVVPWPVIQSPEFYSLFGKMRTRLMKQRVTHSSAGEFLLTLKTLMAKLKAQDWASIDQNLTKHRVSSLLQILPTAIAYGVSELSPDVEELKNLDDQKVIPHTDTRAYLHISKVPEEKVSMFSRLVDSWKPDAARYNVDELAKYLNEVVESRIGHVKDWLDANTSRFPSDNADIRRLKQAFDDAAELLRVEVQLCRAACPHCMLSCILPRFHGMGIAHSCRTNHRCLSACEMSEGHLADEKPFCNLRAGHLNRHLCNPGFHCCGELCRFYGHKGCQKLCVKPVEHNSREGHSCSSQTHYCGEPCALQNIVTKNGEYSCADYCTVPCGEEHTIHTCGARDTCPITCELCPRLCTQGDHLHGLVEGAIHLCGQAHPCNRDCEDPGICEINTAPHSVEQTFVGMHETFQYTRYTQVAGRLKCSVTIAPGSLEHLGPHVHDTGPDAIHFCTTACVNCGHFCTLPLGHHQVLHETAHGSMENTRWVVENSNTVEVLGRRFAGQDGGGPQLCNMVCSQLGRHAHIDYCRTDPNQSCQGQEWEHSHEQVSPEPDKPKDWISHKLYWARLGFKDPYSRDEQTEFSKCDTQCPGAEHQAEGTQVSYCTLPLFHPPQSRSGTSGKGYVSADGHSFTCHDPALSRPAYHMIFVLDRSWSMKEQDRTPLPDTPATSKITSHHNNRFGAVLSALYEFWTSRAASVSGSRRDSYSIILFHHEVEVVLENDFRSDPDGLLDQLLGVKLTGGTCFESALATIKTLMESHWSSERSPVVIFLSDGESRVSNDVIVNLARRAVSLGKPLSLHTISFGTEAKFTSLRSMARIANKIGQNAPRKVLTPPVTSTYSNVISTVQLAETFLDIAKSLRNPRAALIGTES